MLSVYLFVVPKGMPFVYYVRSWSVCFVLVCECQCAYARVCVRVCVQV